MDEADLSLFAHVVGRPDAHVDLAQAALMIAEGEYPNLDIPTYITALDRFAARARRALASAATRTTTTTRATASSTTCSTGAWGSPSRWASC
jgi:hypothetical protein